jgi:PhnB protein
MVVRGSEVPVGRVIPHLVVHDARGAVEFYKHAFGAEEVYRSRQPDGRGVHVHLRVAESLVIVSDATNYDRGSIDAHNRIAPPNSLGGTTAVFQFFWRDADAAYQRAIDAGAQPTVPMFDAFWGDRYGCVTDPYGHVWAFATVQEVLGADEIEQRMSRMYPQGAIQGASTSQKDRGGK